MAPHITCQSIRIPVNRSGEVEQGFLVFADDALMAVVMLLDGSLDEELNHLKGRWFMETGYGPCAVAPGTDQIFQSPDEAQQWVLERVSNSN
ncbi:MAG TPA: hypothetical protein VHL98_22165 [Microvirga sp.]|jgi:hypothetical protein|nr:hypothetical protein [Microvirga sp.]